MLRLRLATLALASGLLVTMSGCATLCNNEPMFPRLRGVFTSRSAHRGTPAECDCAHLTGTHELGGIPAPHFMGPPPITTVPSSAQPGVFRIPEATTVPYAPTLK